VVVILREILAAKPNQRIFLIDPHNEYGRSFRDCAVVLNPKNLTLPFWLFNFEETVDVFFRGRPGLEEEVEVLAQVIPLAKSLFASTRGGEGQTLRKIDPSGTSFTSTRPCPTACPTWSALIDERMGKLENRSTTAKYSRLISRIESARKDPRYAFMFDNANVGGDTMVDVLGQLFRLPPNGKPMTVMQLAGFPAEVVDSVVSVLGRMAFDFGLWSDGASSCCSCARRRIATRRRQEHRLRPDPQGHLAHRQGRPQVRRVPGLVTQRPAELDATIISQCSTLLRCAWPTTRSGGHPRGGLGCGGEPAVVRALARHARSVRVR
jgi:hypothetical protein